jgi:uncharacterized protein YndB with AHSA1/START domain
MTAAAATASTDSAAFAPVRKSVTVRATVDDAFRVFTDDIDSWWPRSHHIGKVPMKRVLLEGFVGGRCYTEQIDGTDCPWGSVLAWDPPRRFVIAWQIDHAWGYVNDLSIVSEVEVRFTAEPDGRTRVDLEHRNFDRMGPAGATMRAAVDDPNGWNGLLALFAGRAGAVTGGPQS